MKKIIKSICFIAVFCAICIWGNVNNFSNGKAYAEDKCEECYTIYDADDKTRVVFMKGDCVCVDDEYISSDNKLYIVESVNDEEKTGVARYAQNVELPVFNIEARQGTQSVVASASKRIGLYHTHNDECYNSADGTDSVYGKGGIHDVGAKFKSNFEKLGITVYYNEDLHLPHDSGAYKRSEQTASELLKNDLDAIFDVHRDATPRSEYIAKVNGETMSKVRMVIGAANVNNEINKEFALSIKSYADQVYPGLIKDIYIGKGNYNQQLFERALLFEFGTNLIEKEYVMKSTEPLSKTIDVVLYGTQMASKESLKDINVDNSTGEFLETGLVKNSNSLAGTKASNRTLWAVLGGIGLVAVIFSIVCACSTRVRQGVRRFFSELFAIFKKKPSK